MWILPRNLPPSSGAPDTAGFISDLDEQSRICASSLMVRSKPSPARTWSQKWKRDSWTQHLFGRILKPSHAKPFETAWASLWPVIPANPLAQQASDSEPKTPDTSGPTSFGQLELFAPECASSRMSKDTLAWDSAKSSETWEQQVTRRRGEYSARVKSARRISGSGCSSWPTATVTDSSAMSPEPRPSRIATGRKTEYLARMVNWPTVTANEDSYRIGGESQQSKCLSAMARRGEMSSWPTPCANDDNKTPEAHLAMKKRMGERDGTFSNRTAITSLQVMCKALHGQAAPASSSSHGSRPESQQDWRTPGASDGEGGVMEMREGCAGKYKLRDHVVAEQKQWATPIQGDSHLVSTPEVAQKRIKEGKVTLSRQNSGKLNPRWVETLMGLPIGWTMPSCSRPLTIAPTSCDSSETESCQQQQNGLLGF